MSLLEPSLAVWLISPRDVFAEDLLALAVCLIAPKDDFARLPKTLVRWWWFLMNETRGKLPPGHDALLFSTSDRPPPEGNSRRIQICMRNGRWIMNFTQGWRNKKINEWANSTPVLTKKKTFFPSIPTIYFTLLASGKLELILPL